MFAVPSLELTIPRVVAIAGLVASLAGVDGRTVRPGKVIASRPSRMARAT
jgi:hypothetical protein